MAVTVQAKVGIERDIRLSQSEHMYVGTWSPTDEYSTGGDPFDVAGNERFERVLFTPVNGYVLEFVKATQKVKIRVQKDPAAVGGADVPLTELAAAVDLHATSFDFIAFGG